MKNSNQTQRGAIAIYMSLIIIFVLLSSALLFNSILSRQIRLSGEIAFSERAFYAANTGFEEALYNITTQEGPEFEGAGQVEYQDGDNANFTYKAKVFEQNDTRVPCVLSTGTLRTETRRLFIGPADCDLQ